MRDLSLVFDEALNGDAYQFIRAPKLARAELLVDGLLYFGAEFYVDVTNSSYCNCTRLFCACGSPTGDGVRVCSPRQKSRYDV